MPDEIRYLTAEDLAVIAGHATGSTAAIRDYGLLDAAANRPCASAFGRDAYPTIHQKAAAMLSSVAFNHALVDGNKRTAWLATYVFYDINGYNLDEPDDNAPVDLLLTMIQDHLGVDEVAAWLAERAKPQ